MTSELERINQMLNDPDSGLSKEERAELVLVAHQRHRGGCLCGYNELGKSFAGHQVAMLREAGVLTVE